MARHRAQSTPPRLTSRWLAEKLGLAQSTVSMALRDHPAINVETRRRVQEAARVLGYMPDGIARAMRTGASRVLGFIAPKLGLSYFAEILEGVESGARERGYRCLIGQSQSDVARMADEVGLLRSQRVDGLALIPVNSEEGLELYTDLTAKGVRFVIVDVPVSGFEKEFVGPDNRAAGFLATRHLLELGHRRIAWLRGYPRAANACLREQGYRAALAKHRIRVDEKLLAGDNFGVMAGDAAVEELLRRKARFAAIAASTDLQACGAIRALHRHGLAVPGDVSVVGCSNLDFSALHTPAITSVDQKPCEVGRRAALRLIDRIEGRASEPDSGLVAPELVARESTARRGKR